MWFATFFDLQTPKYFSVSLFVVYCSLIRNDSLFLITISVCHRNSRGNGFMDLGVLKNTALNDFFLIL